MTAVVCPQCGANVHVDAREASGAECDFCQTKVRVPVAGESPAASWGDPSSWSGWFWGAIWLVVLAVIVAVLLPAQSSAREAARRTQCKNNLRQVGLAMSNYASSFDAYPPAYAEDGQGNRLYGWRIYLAPVLEHTNFGEVFDRKAAWNSPQNAPHTMRGFDAFCCPSDSSHATTGMTHYVAIVDPAGVFTGAKPVRLAEITDGIEQTLAAIEIDQPIPWASANDPTLQQVLIWLQNRRNLGGNHSGGLHVLLCDNSVRFISLEELTPEVLRALVTRAGGEMLEEMNNGWRLKK